MTISYYIASPMSKEGHPERSERTVQQPAVVPATPSAVASTPEVR